MRNISAALLAALDAPTVKLCFLVDLDFQTEALRLHTWIGPFHGVDPFSGERQTFRGVGGLGKISGLEQPEELRASGVQLQLSGIDPDSIATALDTDFQGRAAKVHMGIVDPETEAGLLFDELIPVARGTMDTIRAEIGDTATLTLGVVNGLENWERPRSSRYSDAEQRRLYPGDTSCSRIAVAAEAEIVWKSI